MFWQIALAYYAIRGLIGFISPRINEAVYVCMYAPNDDKATDRSDAQTTRRPNDQRPSDRTNEKRSNGVTERPDNQKIEQPIDRTNL